MIEQLNEQLVQHRIDEVYKEIDEIKALKKNNRVTMEDTEDVSDNYQMNLEWNYALSELQDELDLLIQHRNSFHE